MKLKNINRPIEHGSGEPMTALSYTTDLFVEKHLPQVKIENIDPRARIHTTFKFTFPEGTTYHFKGSQHAGHRPSHYYTLPTGEVLVLSNYWHSSPYVMWLNRYDFEPFKSEATQKQAELADAAYNRYKKENHEQY